MRNTLNRWTAAVCGLALALTTATPLAVAQSAADPAKPIAVVALSSYSELMQDADFIGGVLGMPGASQMVDMLVTQSTQGKGLAGVDKTQPLGVIVQPGEMTPSFAVCLPVTDQAALLDLAAGMVGATNQDMGNGITQIKALAQDVYAKNAAGWTVISTSPESLATAPGDPAAILTPLTTDYDLAVQVNVQNLPEAWKQQAIEMMSSSAKQGLVKKADESDEVFASRTKFIEAGIAHNTQMIQEVDQFTFGLSINGEAKKAYIDVAYTAVPGSPLSEEIAASTQATTNFAGFAAPDTAVSFAFAGKVTESTMTQISQAIDQGRTQIDQAIDKEAKPESQEALKAAFADILAALEATIQGGSMDGAGSLSLQPDSATLVIGGLIADPSKIESALKKLVEAAKSDSTIEMPEVAWAAESADGVTFHTMQIPVKKDEPKQLVGENLDIVVGLGPKAAYLAVGRGAIDALKAAISTSAGSPDKAIPPAEVTVSVGQILTTAAAVAPADKKPMLSMVAGMLNDGSDHVHVIAEAVPNGVRMRFEVEQGVLQAIGSAAMMGMHGGGAPAGPPVR